MSTNDPNDLAKAFMPQKPLSNGMTPNQMLEKLLNAVDEKTFVSAAKKASRISLKDKLSQRITDARNTLDMLEGAASQLDKLQLAEGEAAFHPDHGNVLLREYYLGDATRDEDVRKEQHGKVMAKIVTLNHGITTVIASTLLPLNETTKVLYGKSK